VRLFPDDPASQDWQNDHQVLAFYDASGAAPIIHMGAALSELRDTAPWDDGHLLLATRKNLCILDIVRSICSLPPRAPRAGAVTTIARDGAGRFWLGGRGLWALDERGNVIRFDSAAPFLRDTEVYGIRTDGHRIGLALGRRGLAIVDTRAVGVGPCPSH